MASFEYTARNASGEKVVGSIEADSAAAAMRSLDERRLFPVQIVEKAASRAETSTRRVRSRDLGIFYGQLADLLHSGVPLLKAIDSLIRSSFNPRLKALLRKIRDDVAEGTSLTEAFRQHPHAFPLLHVAMVQAGERASFLEEVLYSLSGFIERLDELQGKVRGAMIYPALLCALGTTVMVAALMFFVPKFEPLLEGVEKPLPTLVIFGLSALARQHWFTAILLMALATWVLVSVVRSEWGRDVYERLRFRIPVLGNAMRMVAITRFCRILGTMLANGVPMLQALTISRDATGSRVMAELIEAAAESVRGGETLSGPLGQGNVFPAQILAMITVAEESNQLEKVLVQIADTVERRTHRQVDQAMRLLEPVILCLVAVAIGFLALGLLLPIFTLAGSIGAT